MTSYKPIEPNYKDLEDGYYRVMGKTGTYIYVGNGEICVVRTLFKEDELSQAVLRGMKRDVGEK